MKDDYLDTSLQFYKEDLKAARENDKKAYCTWKCNWFRAWKYIISGKNKI